MGEFFVLPLFFLGFYALLKPEKLWEIQHFFWSFERSLFVREKPLEEETPTSFALLMNRLLGAAIILVCLFLFVVLFLEYGS